MKRTVKMIRKIFIAVLAFSMVFSIDTVAFAESVGNSYGNNVVSELCKDDEHNYIDMVIPATLTENGIVTSICSICGNEKITHIYYPQVFNISDAEYTGKAILKANVKPVANVKWKTSNSKIATVNKKGVVNGKAVGKAMITASFKYKGKTYKKVCKVNVTKAKSKKMTLIYVPVF